MKICIHESQKCLFTSQHLYLSNTVYNCFYILIKVAFKIIDSLHTLHKKAGCLACCRRLNRVCCLHVVYELIGCIEARAVQTVVRPEGHAEELPVRLNLEVFELPAVPGVFPVTGHEVGELHIVTG